MRKQILLKYKFLYNFYDCQFKDSFNGTDFSDFLKLCSPLTEVIIDSSPQSPSSSPSNRSIRYVFVTRTLNSVLNCQCSATSLLFTLSNHRNWITEVILLWCILSKCSPVIPNGIIAIDRLLTFNEKYNLCKGTVGVFRSVSSVHFSLHPSWGVIIIIIIIIISIISISIIRMDLKEVGCGYMDWIGVAQDRQVADACACGNEPSGSVKCGEILD